MCLTRFAISTCTVRYGRYIPARQVTGTRTACYRAVPPKIDCRRSISVVGGRLKKKSTVGSRLREKSTVGGRLRKKKGRKRGKEEKRSGEYLDCGAGRFFSRARRRSVSPCGEKDRGDVAMCNFQTIKDAADVAIATMLSGIQVKP
ncbi:hypothetical protein GW17_00007589 [Ensete ventricosum]|nr:hypothetical protein GW17_00007589 [Ensete ventricosum]